MNKEISVIVVGFPVKQFAEELKSINATTHAFSSLEIPADASQGLIVSPEATTILVAGVNALALLINSILVFLARRKSGSVRIVGSSGEVLEFPYHTPPEKIQLYLETAQKMEIERLVVVQENHALSTRQASGTQPPTPKRSLRKLIRRKGHEKEV